ncbi:MAG TPA: serine/threonine-protein kinase [Arenimonas sp.]|uniref:serine/threonine-protein kinase n=1 Tax=Arenimonas sp. TaxID=1872635 RepID=UPI002D7F28ED|nr:serine/threonine-protein kinase [Arenimonas sp.]HEU0152901.1 serine/threonine-protein kinase [Arenimonas sp.]
MATSLEIQVLQLFEQALAQPPGQREAWLAAQAVPAEVAGRVQGLLRAELATSVTMDETEVLPDETPPEFPQAGERLGNYELVRPLEAGGMGVVYLGRRADNAYDQQVAIKLVRPVHLLATADFRRQLITRFEEERTILARMSHPNVARILDGGSTATGIPYLVMEYVDGISLTEYCKREKLDVPARLALFCKVCDGVQEAHRHLVVHRDLKPDNILVVANGEPRLLDFGIAKILGQEPLGDDGKPQTSLSAMTPAYASPEQVRQEALTTSSDVYSLGVMLYQLLAGVRPYELGGLRPAEAEHVVCDTLPEPMVRKLGSAAITDEERRRRRAQLTVDVERIVAKAMHKDAGRRYGSAQEMADDIRRYLAGEPVQAHPDSTGYRLRKFLGRHRIGAAAASLALAAILGASGVAFWQAGEARRAASDMEEINQFLMGVLQLTDPYSSGGEFTLNEAVDLAVDAVDKRFAGRPHLASGVRFSLGYSLLNRGQLAAAETQLAKALAESEQSMGARHLRTLQIREAIAQLRLAQGRDEEGEAMLRSLLDDLVASGRDEAPLRRLVLTNLGQYYLTRENYPEARTTLEQARALPEPAPGTLAPTAQAVLLSNLAYAAHGLGELDEADRLFTEAEAEFARVSDLGSAELASLLNNRAFLLDDQGKADEAYAMRQRAVAMRRSVLGDSHPAMVMPLLDLAQVALMRGDAEDGLALATEAVGVAGRAYPEANEYTVFAKLIRAGALINSKRFLEAGETLVLAETELAGLAEPPDYVVQGARYTRDGLCRRPRSPPVPSCAGITPTEPALP